MAGSAGGHCESHPSPGLPVPLGYELIDPRLMRPTVSLYLARVWAMLWAAVLLIPGRLGRSRLHIWLQSRHTRRGGARAALPVERALAGWAPSQSLTPASLSAPRGAV